MRKIFMSITVILCFAQPTFSQSYKVGILFDQFASVRWTIDSMHLRQSFEALDMSVDIQVAHSQLEVQKQQARAMIEAQVDALIIVAVDGSKLEDIVAEAKSNNIVVVAYARPILSSDIDFFIGYNNAEVGQQQALSVIKSMDQGKVMLINGPSSDNNAVVFRDNQLQVLQPYLESGAIQIVNDIILESWDEMSVLLKLYEIKPNMEEINAVIAATDNCVKALMEYVNDEEILKKIYITGQDPTSETIYRIEKSIQNMTALKPIQPLGKKTASLTRALLMGEKDLKFSTLNIEGNTLNAYLFNPTIINEDNIDVFKVLIK
ncbi:MAG: substrate-binding domain-containing protein [Reichenbachiella sp.]|uniref:substrate-binding domain-containing protein n=1 Tax=Reichenbachiella sp. TaxID=2184521 RepID=UPI00296681A3|nr:substrate-binding domain-containing protein [Reichenbachiella sp.]MDW3212011.1 substrate-binding domain-containing protein [Reichenbachiella sp.]